MPSKNSSSSRLQKAKLGTKNGKIKPFPVLFNPTEYVMERSVNYASHNILGLDTPIMQFVNGSSDTLTMELFFDTYSAAEETGDSKLKANGEKTEASKTDVRDYTDKVYKLMNVDGSLHAPPLATFEWGAVKFEGYVTSVKQTFTKFTYKGTPVRARLEVTFTAAQGCNEQLRKEPRNSPDRTKFRRMSEGDTLTALAAAEYGDPEQWREIARANNIENPRLIKSGSSLRVPALRD